MALLPMLISVEVTFKHQVQPGKNSMEEVLVLSHCSLLRNP